MIDFTKLKGDEAESWLNLAIDRSLKEGFLLYKVSEYLEPRPADLFDSREQQDRINEKVRKLSRKLGGAPKQFLVRKGAKITDTFDDYIWSTIEEISVLFGRCRTAVIKVHCLLLPQWLLENGPGLIKPDFNEDQIAAFRQIVTEDFWQYAEAAFIRLASLWDRAGQLLDYAFFNIRQYERDGFPAVFDRIKSNYVVLDPTIEKRTYWTNLKSYCNSDKEEGLKWLLRRRNLLVHSMHLGEGSKSDKEDRDLRYHYNHLEEAVRLKLRTKTPHQELQYLHSHLSTFAKLFEAIFDLSLWGVELIAELRKEKKDIIH